MTTDKINGVLTGGLWLTVSDLARAKGIDKGAVSRRLAKFEAEGLVSTKPGPRGSKLVNAAEYDKAAGDIGDTLRATVGSAAPDPVEQTDAAKLTAERARKEGYAAELARMDYEERLGKLLKVEDIVAAVTTVGESLVRGINGLPSKADDIAAAVAKDGAAGARMALKEAAYDLCELLAGSLKKLVTAPPAVDEPATTAATRPLATYDQA